MRSQFPSIQSFYKTTKPAAATPQGLDASWSSPPGDGFAKEEIDAVLHPRIDEQWLPDREYEDVEIVSLVPGPGCVMIRGRIANFHHQATPSKRPRAAKGCVKIIIKDDSGAITIKLWYAQLAYDLRLGQLVSVWTPHVSNGEHGNLASAHAPLFTSIFPERDRSCHFLIHENSDDGVQCTTPLGYHPNQPLSGLLTLKNFVDGGYDIADNRILVCVKSIGAKKRIFSDTSEKVSPDSSALHLVALKNLKFPPNDCLTVQIFDSTLPSASLTFWGPTTASATYWTPSETILLISNPGWRIERNDSVKISITSSTLVDVNPSLPDTAWLRAFASRLTRCEDVNPPFPTKKELDVKAAEAALYQIYFTFADLDIFARAAPSEKFTGWISVLLMEINLSLLARRNMLLCGMHCGVPIYCNSTSAVCKQCDTTMNLRLNPRILGPVVDETGASQTGKLFFSDGAWRQLLGRSKEDLAAMDTEALRYTEQRMLYLRVNMRIAWWAEGDDVGRLWVFAVDS